MIKSRGNARCTDLAHVYSMPEITCKAGVNDVATCTRPLWRPRGGEFR